MREDELRILHQAGEAVVAYSKETKAPVLRVQMEDTETQMIGVRVVFQDIEQLMAMEEYQLKDRFMEVFLKELIGKRYPFGEAPGFRFLFDVTI